MRYNKKSNLAQTTKKALGLRYGKGDLAPTVSFKGQPYQIDDILKVAEQYGIPVVEDPIVVDFLDKLEVDEMISADMYEAIAAILSHLDEKS